MSATDNLYLIEHKNSESMAHVTCAWKEKKPRISSVEMVTGNVITLSTVRAAINHFEENVPKELEPEQIA